jgi:hypothetical protein
MFFLTFPETFLYVFRGESGACTAAQPATLLLLMTSSTQLSASVSLWWCLTERKSGYLRTNYRTVVQSATFSKRPPAPSFLPSDSLFGPYFYFDRQATAEPTRPATLQPFPSTSSSSRQHVKRIHLCGDIRTLRKEGSVPSDP